MMNCLFLKSICIMNENVMKNCLQPKSLTWLFESSDLYLQKPNCAALTKCIICRITDPDLFLNDFTHTHSSTPISFSVSAKHHAAGRCCFHCSETQRTLQSSVTRVKKPFSVCCLLLPSDKSDILLKTTMRLNTEQCEGFVLSRMTSKRTHLLP